MRFNKLVSRNNWVFAAILTLCSCNNTQQNVAEPEIVKISCMPIYSHGSSRKSFRLVKNKSEKIDFVRTSFYPISISDSSIRAITMLIEASSFQDYHGYKEPRDSTIVYEYEILTFSKDNDTLSHKVVNKLHNKDFFKKVFDLVESDKSDTLISQKRAILATLRGHFRISHTSDSLIHEPRKEVKEE